MGPPAAIRRPAPTAGAVLADAARMLAGRGLPALTEVLDLLARALGCDELILRAADTTTVLASAHPSRVVPGWRAPGSCVLDLPVRRTGELCGVLTASTTRAFTDADARLLAGATDVLALALVADGSASWSAARAVLDEEAERAQVSATLLDGVGEALVSVRYAAELVAAGRADAAALEEPVRAALAAVRNAHRDLRAHAMESGLRAALAALPDRWGGDRPDDGLPELRLSVRAEDPELDTLPPPIAVTVQRVAELALRGATGRASVTAFCTGSEVKLDVESAEIAYDASELSRWARRALALGGDLQLRPDGVELSLPAELSPAGSATQCEGRHDDGSDL